MVGVKNTQSLTEFFTIDGQTRAVLLSPAVFEELSEELCLARDVTVVRRSMDQVAAGDRMQAGAFMETVRQQPLAMKADRAGAGQ